MIIGCQIVGLPETCKKNLKFLMTVAEVSSAGGNQRRSVCAVLNALSVAKSKPGVMNRGWSHKGGSARAGASVESLLSNCYLCHPLGLTKLLRIANVIC